MSNSSRTAERHRQTALVHVSTRVRAHGGHVAYVWIVERKAHKSDHLCVGEGDPARKGTAAGEFPSPASPAVTLKDLNADDVPMRPLPEPSCLRR